MSRNVVELVDIPEGRSGRPSKSLTVRQAELILDHAMASPLYAYIVVSLLTGARTEEMRPLTWDHVVLEVDDSTDPPTPAHMRVRRSEGQRHQDPAVEAKRCAPRPMHIGTSVA